MDLKSLDLKSINFKSKSKFPNTTLSNNMRGGGFTDNPSFNKNIMIKITLYKTDSKT